MKVKAPGHRDSGVGMATLTMSFCNFVAVHEEGKCWGFPHSWLSVPSHFIDFKSPFPKKAHCGVELKLEDSVRHPLQPAALCTEKKKTSEPSLQEPRALEIRDGGRLPMVQVQ